MRHGFTSPDYLIAPAIGLVILIVYITICLLTGTPLSPPYP